MSEPTSLLLVSPWCTSTITPFLLVYPTSSVATPLVIPTHAFSTDAESHRHSPLQPRHLRCNELSSILNSIANLGMQSSLQLTGFEISARLPLPRLLKGFILRISDTESISLDKTVEVYPTSTAPFLRGSLHHFLSGNMFEFVFLVFYGATMILVYMCTCLPPSQYGYYCCQTPSFSPQTVYQSLFPTGRQCDSPLQKVSPLIGPSVNIYLGPLLPDGSPLCRISNGIDHRRFRSHSTSF